MWKILEILSAKKEHFYCAILRCLYPSIIEVAPNRLLLELTYRYFNKQFIISSHQE